MVSFKSIRAEIKVAKIIKIVEAILFLVIMSAFAYGYYDRGNILDVFLALYALYLSFALTRELQEKRHYTKINIGYTLGVMIYTAIAILLNYMSAPLYIGHLFIPIIALWAFNRYVKAFSDLLFPNFNLAANMGVAMSKMNDEELEEFKQKLNGIFDSITDELEKIEEAEKAKIDETSENVDEDTNKNHTEP